MGRPTKLDEQTQTRILQAIQSGATYEIAANYGGVSYNSFNNWMQRGKAELARRDNPRVVEGSKEWLAEQPYVEFFEAVKKAESLGAVGWLLKIEKAANDGNWQAAAWKLERRYPEQYGRQVKDVNHGNKDGNALEILVKYADD